MRGRQARLFGIFEGIGAVADDPAFVALGVAGIARVEGGGAQIERPCPAQQATDRPVAAGLPIFQQIAAQGLDRLAGATVENQGLVIGVIMAQIRTDDDQGFRPAPKRGQNLVYRLRRGVADDDRHQIEFVQGALQKGQMDFQAVFPGMGVVPCRHRRKVEDRGDGRRVERHRTERRVEGRDGRHGEAPEWHPVRRTQQDDPPDASAQGGQTGIGSARDGPRIDIAGMGRDQGFGCGMARADWRGRHRPGRPGPRGRPDRNCLRRPSVARSRRMSPFPWRKG